MMTTERHTSQRPHPTIGATVANLARGAIMGIAETIPGVSGGTLALVTGIYTRLIESANSLMELPRAISSGEFPKAMRRVDWWLLIPVAVGMLSAVFLLAGTMESFVHNHPVIARSLFFGMILASVVVPFQELKPGALERPGMRPKAVIVFAIFAVGLFLLTSLPKAETTSPPLWLVFVAASIAICALVLPGVSGSFFLLVIGLYSPTLQAVDQRNFGYLGVFALGALLGIVLFVRFLEWMLEHHHTLTMAAMAGLLLGSLRALWPWQGYNNELLSVGTDWPMALGMMILGAIVVAVIAAAQRNFTNRNSVD